MVYLSQLLNKPVLLGKRNYGKVVDFGVSENLATGAIGTILIKKGREKYSIDSHDITFLEGSFSIAKEDVTLAPYNENDFYLAEDLLDKQVIDITGRRLVRVNDVILKENGEYKIMGIDIGFSGILRRLGLSSFFRLPTISIPWTVVEAFDYQMGQVRLKLSQSSLNAFHPAELANILEDAGTKERLGVVQMLDPQTAADALEEADPETQQSILEQLPKDSLKRIVQKMSVSEIVDILKELNPFTSRQISQDLGHYKLAIVQRLSQFPDNVAGGLMDINFYQEKEDTTVAETIEFLRLMQRKAEVILVVNKQNELKGLVEVRDLLSLDPHLKLQDAMKECKTVTAEASFREIIYYFAEYKLRALPVTDDQNKILGIISVDVVLMKVHREEEYEEAI